MSYKEPVQLATGHRTEDFSCRSQAQSEWLREHARQSQASRATRVFVVTPSQSNDVVAYYAWTMGQISVAEAPARLSKGAGRYPQPVALLARLGVDERHEGKGLGAALLKDVLIRCASISDRIGCRGLLVHCETDEARRFYNYLIPEFESSPTDENHLVLLIKDIKRSIG